MSSLILRTASVFLLALILIFSAWILLRGHNSPGGGFIAGLMTASAFALYLIAHGAARLRRILFLKLEIMLGLGLLSALGSGFVGLLTGRPFLTTEWTRTFYFKSVPLTFGTPLLFDFGIYLVVVSSVLIMILALKEIR